MQIPFTLTTIASIREKQCPNYMVYNLSIVFNHLREMDLKNVRLIILRATLCKQECKISYAATWKRRNQMTY